MREYSTPSTSPVPTSGNLTDDVVRQARERPDAVLLSRPDGSGGWEDVSASRFRDEVVGVAKGLVALGIEPGDRVGLLSHTRYEWTLVDYAIWFAGAVCVPVYETSSSEQVERVLADSGARAIVVESAQHRDRVDEVRVRLDSLRHVWVLDEDAVPTLTRLGAPVSPDELERRRTSAGPGDLATVIYTSGTTGAPKGCELTHGSFLAELDAAVDALGPLFEGEDAATLLFLPLAHVLARIVQVGAIRSGTRLSHSVGLTGLSADLRAVRPTFVLGVPRVFEKVFTLASQRATADGRGRVFARATDTAIAWSRAREQGRVPVAMRARHATYSRLVHAQIREALGGRCRHAISGGAPLGERLTHFYRGIGITVLEGYGLTETTGAVTVNTPDAVKLGTVGRPLPGTAVRIADDGELLVRGPQVFAGYRGEPEATREVLETDGWLHTGDLGEVDDEGFVRVTGRRNEILVTAGGKNVSPAVLEDVVRSHSLVEQCLVVGDGRPYVAALVTLDRDALLAWAAAHDLDSPVARLLEHPAVLAEVDEAVAEANRGVSKAEAIRRVRVLGGEWTEENGQLTPSLRLRRTVVMRTCRAEIAALYDD